MFNQLLDQLHKVDFKVEKEENALLLLTSLLDSYDNWVTTLLFGKDKSKIGGCHDIAHI